MTDTELRPCPFCGGKELEQYTPGYGWPTIRCVACSAENGPHRRYSCAQMGWNNRPIEDALRAQCDALAGALEKIKEDVNAEEPPCSCCGMGPSVHVGYFDERVSIKDFIDKVLEAYKGGGV